MLTVDDSARTSAKINQLTATEIDDLKQTFARDGYFIIRSVVSPERLAELHKSLEQEFEAASKSGALFSGGGLRSGHLNCFPGAGARFVYDTLQERGIIDLIKEIDPRVVRMPNVGCNFNLPGSHTQHYHLDRPFTRDFMIANIAVVDTNIENGAMEAIPGTHKRFYKYSQFVLERVARKSVRIPLKRGDVLVRSSNVWHRGTGNHTSVPQADACHDLGGRRQQPRRSVCSRRRENPIFAELVQADQSGTDSRAAVCEGPRHLLCSPLCSLSCRQRVLRHHVEGVWVGVVVKHPAGTRNCWRLEAG